MARTGAADSEGGEGALEALVGADSGVEVLEDRGESAFLSNHSLFDCVLLHMSSDRLERLREFQQEDPEDPFTRYALAQEHLKASNTERALDLFEELVETDPDYVGTYYHLGKLYEQLGRADEALEVYDRGIEIAREQGEQKALSELKDAKLEAKGIGFD